MAAKEEPAIDGLRAKLEPLLPKDSRFGIHHISTPPTKSAALCSAPPNERPDRTFCESHFLAVSIEVPEATTTTSTAASGGTGEESPPRKRRVLVLGVEVLLYSTVHSTTLFVSKADSTGYLHLLGLARGAPSPVREVCGAFVAHLVETRRRKGRQFVVSLFARAQSQYLFPGSAGNGGKHVLDDRGLVRWWCRVLSPLLEKPSTENGSDDDDDNDDDDDVRGYLVVPGLEEPETRALLPLTRVRSRWTLGHPLERISHYTREGRDRVPPRCLIPRYPDDPKSRFRDELDEEAARSGGMRTAGSWRSVKTLDVFWEMMAFRQECSSGRMTGFVWVVFDDDPGRAGDTSVPKSPADAGENKTTAAAAQSSRQALLAAERRRRRMIEKKRAKKLRGIIVPRQPRTKTEQRRKYLLERPTRTRHYLWPAAGRGDQIVSETSYRRGVELLLHLDFATLDKAVGSTRRWIQEVGMGSSRWGYEVTGTREVSPPPTCDARNGGEGRGSSSGGKVVATESSGQVNNLSGLVKRKRSAEQGEAGDAAVHVLGGGLVRKKAKKDVSSG